MAPRSPRSRAPYAPMRFISTPEHILDPKLERSKNSLRKYIQPLFFHNRFSQRKRDKNKTEDKTEKMLLWQLCLLIFQVNCGKSRGNRRKQKEEKIERVKILASLPEDDKYLFRKRLERNSFYSKKDTFNK